MPMTTTRKSRFGDLPPQYHFILNPYPDQRLSRCPLCEQRNRQRKLPLLIHVDPLQLIALNYTCRYCPDCDLLIAHKHEIEHLLTEMFRQWAPDMIGNDYLVLGVVDKRAWKEGVTRPKTSSEIWAYMSDFITNYDELRMSRPGYYREGDVPPIMEPPSPREWVRATRRVRRR
jgi:hypothetical protein